MPIEFARPVNLGVATERGSGGFLHPERVVREHFGLRPGMVVADFGCGGGYFTLPIAREIGENGKVFAIDIRKESLDHIKSKANLEHLSNIEPVWADLELERGSRLPEHAVDLVVVANILFQVENKPGLFTEAFRICRSGGRLVALEWDETPFQIGPPMASRVPRALVKRFAEEAGFVFEDEFDAGSHHYGMKFKKE